MGGLFQLSWRRDGDFQELGHHCPLFGLLWLASELSWCLWVCHLAYANVLQWACNEAQGLLEVESSVLLDLIGSNLFYVITSRAMPFFQRLCPAPFPPVSLV